MAHLEMVGVMRMKKPRMTKQAKNPSEVLIDISTAIIRVEDGAVQCRIVYGEDGLPDRLPFGAFLPHKHRTMEIGLREFVWQQVGVKLGHVEQLYTFADQSRHQLGQDGDSHIVSVGYLALTNQSQQAGKTGDWHNIYDYFPWENARGENARGENARGENARGEDSRQTHTDSLDTFILPRLTDWLAQNKSTATHKRARRAFGLDGHIWDEEQTLERYEFLYEVGLMPEARIDKNSDGQIDKQIAHAPDTISADLCGRVLQLDHRRILATALGRLRGKLKYRPVIFDLMPAQFTLTHLQRTTEAVMGLQLHKQNFRRLVEKSGFVISTKKFEKARGRPAELFRFAHEEPAERPLAGLRVQAQRTQKLKKK